MSETGFVGGLLHDIGKLDVLFQSYMQELRGADDVDENIEDGEHIAPEHANGRFSFDVYPRHEEVSWLLFRQLFDHDAVRVGPLGGDSASVPVQQSRLDALAYAIFWHHARPARYRSDVRAAFETAERIEDSLRQRSTWLDDGARGALERFLDDVDRIAGTTLRTTLRADPTWLPAREEPVPAFKANYAKPNRLDSERQEVADTAIRVEMRRTVVRSALVSADRLVSKLCPSALLEHVHDGTLPDVVDADDGLPGLYRQIRAMTSRFEHRHPGPRTFAQGEVAARLEQLAGAGRIACLQGPAGCGKTKIALQFLAALATRRRVVIFVPRTAIGEGLFDEIVSAYDITGNVEYLSGTVKRFRRAGAAETIETPEHLERSGDIVITTIDQLCAAMLSHERIDFVTRMADCHVVFDEAHELVELPGIVALFLEAVAMRRLSVAATLLISATPNPRFLERLGLAPEDVVRMPTFNDRPYRLRLHEIGKDAYRRGGAAAGHPFLDRALPLGSGAFVVCNTATLAQQASIVHREAGRSVLCLHGRFTPQEKRCLVHRALELFGGHAPARTTILVSGPIVQASLNLSTGELHTEATHAENILQRIGRVNRFGELPSATVELYATRDPANGTLGNGATLSHVAQRARAEAFLTFLATRLPEANGVWETTLRLDELYAWYDEFHDTDAARRAYASDFREVLARTRQLFEQGEFDPVQHSRSSSPSASEGPRLAASSLRGRSQYVLPLVLDVDEAEATARLSLLWNGQSSAAERLTDELRSARFDDRVSTHYLMLSSRASRARVVSPLLAGPAGTAFLGALERLSRSARTWPELAARARHPEIPVLVAGESFHEHNLYYLRHHGVALGLMSPKAYDAVARRSLRDLLARRVEGAA